VLTEESITPQNQVSMTVVFRKSPLESSGYLQRATSYKAEDFLEKKDISKQTKGNFDGGKLWSIAACSASTNNIGQNSLLSLDCNWIKRTKVQWPAGVRQTKTDAH